MSDISRPMTFGRILRDSRIRNDFTLRAAAKAIGMDSGNLSKLERGHLAPPSTARAIQNICEPLGISPDLCSLMQDMAFQHRLAILQKEFFG